MFIQTYPHFGNPPGKRAISKRLSER
jgi:hypothetical protein